jgi:hypothetical protein
MRWSWVASRVLGGILEIGERDRGEWDVYASAVNKVSVVY